MRPTEDASRKRHCNHQKRYVQERIVRSISAIRILPVSVP
jgi:hypothetical protein